MKSKDEIERRLKNLRHRYTKQFVSTSQTRTHTNCSFNHEHKSTNHDQVAKQSKQNLSLSPRKSVTLLIVKPDNPIRICMFGSEKSESWNGTICDTDDMSDSCPYFKPLTSPEESLSIFEDKLSDDKYVYDNYRDIAALQWVIGDGYRVHSEKMSLFHRIIMWIHVLFAKPKNKVKSVSDTGNIPNDLWVDK